MTNVIRFASLLPFAHQEINLVDGTSVAIAVNSTMQAARVLAITAETNHARFRADGTDPAMTTGVLIKTTDPILMLAYNGTSKLAFSQSTGESTVQIQGFKLKGDA